MSNFEWVVAAVIAVLSVARTARLLIFDDFPPVMWARIRVRAWVKNEDSKWLGLLDCPFCMGPYLAAGMGVWAWLAWTGDTFHWTWWVINGWWAASYVAAMIVAYDEPAE